VGLWQDCPRKCLPKCESYFFAFVGYHLRFYSTNHLVCVEQGTTHVRGLVGGKGTPDTSLTNETLFKPSLGLSKIQMGDEKD